MDVGQQSAVVPLSRRSFPVKGSLPAYTKTRQVPFERRVIWPRAIRGDVPPEAVPYQTRYHTVTTGDLEPLYPWSEPVPPAGLEPAARGLGVYSVTFSPSNQYCFRS